MARLNLRKLFRKLNKQVLDQNRGWYDEFVNTHFPKERQTPTTAQRARGFFSRYRALWISVGACCLCGVMALAGVLGFWGRGSRGNTKTEMPKRTYGWSSSATVNLDLGQLNDGLTDISVRIDDMSDVCADYDVTHRIYLTYDKSSTDVLWYKIYLTYDGAPFIDADIEIFPNSYFGNYHSVGDDAVKTEIGGLTVTYCQNAEEDDGIYDIRSHAIVERGATSAYIGYRELAYEPNGNFLKFIERSIKAD